ncbi:hypothetical protein LOTGIDRAFT_231541 [Lottia gigantea]|uniref:Farnesyl pyrophosphate synthase n=1 Tax=Lottia gigantea TaxID=225164 RepID=V4ARC7_LOTGI|nr:hypothetical protein LOTGIDRAFT_231541 [Lottia gigantea]ESO97345.1 hypothetical protein LOTGIDRAFT_231541 [Lottia gigantea]
MAHINGTNGTNSNKKVKSTSELEEFDAIFPVLVENLTQNGLKDSEISDAITWFKEVLEYNVPFGKKNRGISVVTSYCQLVQDPTEENLTRARVLGWCVELLQAFFLVADDIMDSSITRRGQPCWYKLNKVGTIAINDSFYLESAIYVLLKKYCRDQPYYVHLMELFHETTLQTVIGQCLDLITSTPSDGVDFTNYTLDRHAAIVKWKTAFYSFYLPVAIAMYMAGIDDSEAHTNAKRILLQMGHFFQVQDDYLDCYGAPEVIGKIGTDIQDNKCGWLVIQALNRVTPEQRQILEENYARDNEEKIEKVKKLYRDLNLSQVYQDYEEKSYQELMNLIEKSSGNLPKQMFIAFAMKIYKRKK